MFDSLTLTQPTQPSNRFSSFLAWNQIHEPAQGPRRPPPSSTKINSGRLHVSTMIERAQYKLSLALRILASTKFGRCYVSSCEVSIFSRCVLALYYFTGYMGAAKNQRKISCNRTWYNNENNSWISAWEAVMNIIVVLIPCLACSLLVLHLLSWQLCLL